MILAYFVLLKVFLIVFYFDDRLFKRKSVEKSTQVSTRISYFFFFFMLNENKKKPLKIRFREEGYKKIFDRRKVNRPLMG